MGSISTQFFKFTKIMSKNGQPIGQLFETTESPKSARTRLVALLLPVGLVLGFALFFALLFRDRLLPATKVEVFPAVAIEEKALGRDATEQKAAATGGGALLFQASGWIEPDPLPVKATALTDGIVDQVHVLQGELVKKGDLLATLIDTDLRIERDIVAARLAELRAAFDAHCVATQVQLKRMDIEKAEQKIAEANASEAENKLRRYEKMTRGAITEDERIAVRFDHTRSLAKVDMATARIEEIAENLNRIAYEVLAMQAELQQAEVQLEKAELAYSRTKITAPADGRVLALMATPGQPKMVGSDLEDSTTIAVLYDPAHLQVRVDVPLGDAAGLSVGQRARIRCNLLPDEIFEGEVTRIEGAADLQRNTLQAKVRIFDPSEKLRPEMLSRVEFLETISTAETTVQPADGATDVAVYVPVTAVSGDAVWICDPDSLRAEKRKVSISAEREGMVRVDEGIRPGEWVVSGPSNLKSGQRLNPIFNEKS